MVDKKEIQFEKNQGISVKKSLVYGNYGISILDLWSKVLFHFAWVENFMTVIFKNERKDSGVNSQKNFIDK